jgi:arabinose-5-phosphate isomerase
MKKNSKQIAKQVIDYEITALKLLKNSLNKEFDNAVDAIVNCHSKIILCGVGKSGLIASKISATLSSVGSPSFSLSANDCLHGDLGSITKKDVLILISNSGKSDEIIPIIKFANRNKVKLIGIVSNKNSILYKGSDIKILLPKVKEAGLEIVPTSSTSIQLAIGDCLAIAALKRKQFSKFDFSKFHPGGNIGKQLKTVNEIMSVGNQIPFVNENQKMKFALKIITQKKLGVLIAKNRKNLTTGIITDGNIRKLRQYKGDLQNTTVKDVMKKKPFTIDHNTLAVKALQIMNEKKITSLCVHKDNKPNKTIGLLHIHHILSSNLG